MTNRDIVTAWVEGYRKAWESNDPADIRAIFTEDAIYAGRPRDPKQAIGLEAIVANWLEDADEPGTTQFDWHIVAVEGDTAVVQCVVTYPDTVYDNLWVVRLAEDGRASEYTDWWVARS